MQTTVTETNVGINARPGLLKSTRTAIIGMIGALVIAACNTSGGPVKDTAAQNLLPTLPGYNTENVSDIQKSLTNLTASGAAVTGNAPLAGVIKLVGDVGACYQQAGALEGRTYVKAAEPYKGGIVFVINRNALTSPANFLQCVLPSVPQGLAEDLFSPCAKSYTLAKDNNEFYIAFAATNREVCTAFCSAMEGCTGEF